MKRSLISEVFSGLLIIPAAILGLAGILMLLTLFFFTGSALGLEENLDVILSVLLTTVGLFLCYKSQRSKTINLAAFHGKIKSVKKHLTSGVDVNHKDKEERTPLHEATGAGHKEIAELLIGAGAEVNSTDENGGTPLHFAAWKGHKEIAELLITKGADVNAKIEVGDTPLHQAASNGRKEVAELLLAKGADVNAMADGGLTPLHTTTLDGYKEIAELLIAKGADVNAKDEGGDTPLDWATSLGKTETAALLRKHGGKNGAIHGAAGGGDIEAIKEFLAAGTDVNAKNDNGVTPLHGAVYSGHKELIELLIAKGANVNAIDADGRTPLGWAKHPDNTNDTAETADLLRKHGGKTGEELKAEGK